MKKSDIAGSPKKKMGFSSADKSSKAIQTENKNSNSNSNHDCVQESVASSSKNPFGKKEETIKKQEKEPRKDKSHWRSLKHKGPIFAPPYQSLPEDIKFFYEDKPMCLSKNAEEVARFYAELLDNDCITEEAFRNNFFKEWRQVMSEDERSRITELSKCNFKKMQQYSKDETKAIKQQPEEQQELYRYCTIDGCDQKIKNCKVEPPGLFGGKKGNPYNGRIKKRVQPEDVTINCSRDGILDHPSGHQWKEVVNNPKVTWLAKWTDELLNKQKYIQLHESSPLKGELDQEKFQIARRLGIHINKIRKSYKEDWQSNSIKIQQRGIALYFIDKLAFRVGHEKEEDTVGCCALRVEHVKLHTKDEICVLSFDFYEKGFSRYKNQVNIEELAYAKLQTFVENKDPKNDLFDQLVAKDLNDHLNQFMESLTAKVFRTYNASLTFERKLDELIKPGSTKEEKMLCFKEAVLAVATLCNHQRASTKPVDVLTEQLQQLSISPTKDDNKETDITNTKLYYLDPRITVAWCMKNNIPIEVVFTKQEYDKFKWATEKPDQEYRFGLIEPNTRKKLF